MQWKRKNVVTSANAKPARAIRPTRTSADAAAVAPAPAARSSPLTIARAAAGAEVGVETIRFYEREGLIAQPPRPSSGYRTYPPGTVQRVRFIRHCQELGFSLKETREFLRLNDEGTGDCDEACARVEAKIQDLGTRISALGDLRDKLQRLLGHCPEGHCLIMDELNLAVGSGPGCATCSTNP